MFVCCECCVCLSGRGLCDGLITLIEILSGFLQNLLENSGLIFYIRQHLFTSTSLSIVYSVIPLCVKVWCF